jgi:putative colanic acid biosynthesis UDP-glucose lipid carrier transferase
MWADNVLSGIVDGESPGGRLRPHRSTLSLIQRAADGVLILVALDLACRWTGAGWSAPAAAAGLAGAALFYLVAEGKRLYRSWRTESILAEVQGTVEAWIWVAALSLAAIYLQRGRVAYPEEALPIWLIGTPVLLVAWRILFRRLVRWARSMGINTRSLAIAGGGELARHIALCIQGNPWMGYRIVGLFDDPEPTGAERGLGSCASLDSLVAMARQGEIDCVYIALPPGRSERQADALVRRLSDATASVYLVQDRRSRAPDGEKGSRQVLPDLARLDLLQRRCLTLGGIKAASLYESPFNGPDAIAKRIEDLLVAGTALLLLALPMAAIAAAVKLSGPGPVFFKQRRYGLDGREIMVWKFRSMSVCEDGAQVAQARKGDARVTHLGRILRRTSLDELPQLFNVIQGSMSVVGPRPHAVAHNEHYRALIGGYMLRHKVKPGITGWAQVNGWRGETDSIDKMGRRVDFDLEYIRHWSLGLDLRIILMTAVHGFVHRNAY